MVRSDGTLAFPARIALIALAVVGLALAGADPFTLISFVAYLAIGVLLAIKRPDTIVSWLLIGIAFSFIGTTTQPGVDVQGLIDGTAPPYDRIVTWVGVWSGMAVFVLYTALAAVFPTGKLPAGRWGRALKVVLTLGAAMVVLSAIAPTVAVTEGDVMVAVPNPFGLLPSGPLSDVGQVISLGVVLAGLAIAVASLLTRYHGAVDVARLQMRWLLAAISFVLLGLVLGIGLTAISGDALGGVVWIPVLVAYPTVPIAIGIAIFRYRLYEIDRIVNRALVYGAVTAILAGVFAAASALSQRVFITVTGESSDAGIVLTTLAVATAYTPVRKRVESFVDRYFKYEQRRFGAYRDELDRLLELVDPVHAAGRLAREAVAETGAIGAAVTGTNGHVLATAGKWPSATTVTVAIGFDAPLGAILLGPRRGGRPYDPAVVESLGEIAARVVAAIGARQVVHGDLAGNHVAEGKVVAARVMRDEAIEDETIADMISADQVAPSDGLA
jgi:hypothetical protein